MHPGSCGPLCQHPGCWQAKSQNSQCPPHWTNSHTNNLNSKQTSSMSLRQQNHFSNKPVKGHETRGADKPPGVRSKFALPRLSDIKGRPNAAVNYVEQLHGPLGSKSKSKPLQRGTNLPSVVYKDLHIDPPLPSYYDNFWYHELRSSPVDYSRLGDDDYTASSNDAINVMDRRSRRDLSPPRVTKLNVFLDGPSPSKKQYVWQQNATPPGHPNIPAQGAGYYWNESSSSFQDYPLHSIPSVTPNQMTGQHKPHMHSFSLNLLPTDSGNVSRLDSLAATTTSRGSSRLRQLTAMDRNPEGSYTIQPTTLENCAHTRHMRKNHEGRFPPIQPKHNGSTAIPVHPAVLSNSSMSSTALHHSHRLRKQLPSPTWNFAEIARLCRTTSDTGEIKEAVYTGQAKKNAGRRYQQHGSKLQGMEPTALSVVEPELHLESHPTTMPLFLKQLLDKASLRMKTENAVGGTSTDPPEVFGSDLYLMAPAAANSPTPAEFKSTWMPDGNDPGTSPPSSVPYLPTSTTTSHRLIAPRNSPRDPFSPGSTENSFASVSLPAMSPYSDSPLQDPFSPAMGEERSANSLLQERVNMAANRPLWTREEAELASPQQQHLLPKWDYCQRRNMPTPTVPFSTPIVDSLDLARSFPRAPAPSPIPDAGSNHYGNLPGVAPLLNVPLHIINDHIVENTAGEKSSMADSKPDD